MDHNWTLTAVLGRKLLTKTVLGVAGGIVLAVIVLSALDIVVGVAPAFAELLAVIFADEEFWITVGALGALCAYYYFVVRRTGRWLP